RALPEKSSAAASACLDAAVQRGNEAAAEQSLTWLLSLPSPGNAAEAAAEKRALIGWLEASWRLWPGHMGPLWAEAARQGRLPGPPKSAHAPFLRNGNFDPA